jgi:hypothetical protein
MPIHILILDGGSVKSSSRRKGGASQAIQWFAPQLACKDV